MTNYASIHFEKNALPSIQESILLSKKILEQKLAVCKNRLKAFENEKQMDTDSFLARFEKGELGDEKEWIAWEHFAGVASILEKKLYDLESIRYEH